MMTSSVVFDWFYVVEKFTEKKSKIIGEEKISIAPPKEHITNAHHFHFDSLEMVVM
jgi:hypothetical protein